MEVLRKTRLLVVALVALVASAHAHAVAPISISMTSPADGSTYTAPATIALKAQAFALEDGYRVSSVTFLSGGQPIYTDDSWPYGFDWENAPVGTHILSALATDNTGDTVTSTAVTVRVIAGSISASPNPCDISYGASTCTSAVSWSSTEPDAAVWISGIDNADLQLFRSGQNGFQYLTSVTTDPVRLHLKAGGLTMATVDVHGTATINAAPTIELTAPTAGEQGDAPATIIMSATALDSDDGVALVSFYVNGAAIASKSSAPYSFEWKEVAAGSYSIRAVAVDTRGATAASPAVTITVAQPPAPPPPPPPGSGTPVQPDVASDQVAATAAEFRVDEAGAATYSIPLYAVPGTAGVSPKLALSYSSQGGYGPLGRGWAISGLSSISRCRATREAGDFIVGGVAVDGNPAPINFTSSDRFCLDGQRLIPAQRGSGACKAIGGMTAANLRTEIESFQRVCGYTPTSGTNGPAFFRVDSKDGATSWYGDRDNDGSSNRPDGYFASTAPGKTATALAWAQTRLQDSAGNYIDFVYRDGTGVGEHVISEVRYTGKTVLPGQAGSAHQPYAKIGFSYESRIAETSGYVAGGLLTQRERLVGVTSCATAAEGDCTTSAQVRFYQLNYTTNAFPSGSDTLASVQECRDATRAVCLPGTTITWTAPLLSFFETQESSGSIPNGSLTKFEGLKFGDIDGDGRRDLVWIKDGQRGEDCPTDSIYVAYARLDDQGAPFFTVGHPVLCAPAELRGDPPDASWFLLDYNGDGRDDIFLSKVDSWVGYLSNGSNRPFLESANVLAELSQPIPAGTTLDTEPQHADLNGDGLIDLIYPSGTGLVARLMERGGAYGFRWGNARPITLTNDTCTNDCFVVDGLYRKDNYQQLNDFDGDSRSDLLINVQASCSGNSGGGGRRDGGRRPIKVQSASGAQTVSTTSRTCPRAMSFTVDSVTAGSVTLKRYGTHTIDPSSDVSFADINGDGLSDLVFHGTNYAIPTFSINTGAGYTSGGNLGFGVNTSQVRVADVNGDGRADILYPSADYTHLIARYGMSSGAVSSAFALPTVTTGCRTRNCLLRRAFIFTDVDGDGNVDYMRINWDDSRSPVYFSRSSANKRFAPREVISRITNGMGAETDITYASMTNGSVYRADRGSRNAYLWGRGSPVQDVKTPTYLVARAASSSPQAGQPLAKATVHYRYAGAKMQAGGRGSLGFREIVTIDSNQSGGFVTTQTTYHQNFPFAGMPAQTIKRAASGSYAIPACLAGVINDSCFSLPGTSFLTPAGSWFSDSIQVWEADTDISGTASAPFASGVQAPLHIRTAGSDEHLRDPFTGARTSRVATTFDYAAYGNIGATSVDTYTGAGTLTSTVLTSNTYGDNPALWRLGRLTASTVTHSRPGRPDVVRNASFAYDMAGAATGQLTMERTQPGGGIAQDLIKTYALDPYGNQTRASICSADIANCGTTGVPFHPSAAQSIHRTTRVAFDSLGRFPVATYEPFWSGAGAVEKTTQTVVARNVFGDVTQAVDANGVDTLAVAGTFGRPYYSWVETVAGSAPGAEAGGVGSTTSYRWCGSGGVDCPTGARFRQTVISDGAPRQWTWFDILGRPVLKASETFNVGVAGKDVSAVCTTYDPTGKPYQTSNPFFLPGTSGSNGPAGLGSVCSSGRLWTTAYYDLLGRATDVVGADGSVASSDYAGATTTQIDARGNRTARTVNGAGELTLVTDAAGLKTSYAYNADGTLAQVSRNAGRGVIANLFDYDARGRKIAQDDPDTGLSSYEYNALGELTAQIDAVGNRIQNDIDARGRVWRKTVLRADGTVESQTVTSFDTAAGGLGQAASESIAGTYTAWVGLAGMGLDFSRSYRYDGLGRPSGSTTAIDGAHYTASAQYDSRGRPWKARDASGRWSKTVFNARGMAMAVCNSSASDSAASCPASSDTYLRTLETDEWGHTIREQRGNSPAMEVTSTYVANNGRIFSICAGNQASCNLMDEGYAWDASGNLSMQRKEGRYLEEFTYDSLNRLKTGRLVMQDGVTANRLVQSFEYDAVGNLCRKESGGTSNVYTYIGRSGCGLGGALNSTSGGGGNGPGGAHQVSAVNGTTYYYDVRGNQTIKDAPGTNASLDRTIAYTIDDQANEAVSGNGARTRFWYGSDGARYKREDGSKRTVYLGNVEIVTQGGVTTTKRTIAGVMLQTVVGGVSTDHYLFHDQLGNLVKVTDKNGATINSQDYAAFGARRDYDDAGLSTGSAPTITTRGFTGHEMVDGVLGLVHMNGRIFDPGVGRFLQADPFIQASDNAQSWNAYTYVFNNPYRYTDPTGNLGVEERQWLGAIITIAAVITQQYWAASLTTTTSVAIVVGGGFVGGAVATQSLRGGLMGAFTALAGYGFASIGGGGFDAWALRTAGGGVLGSIQGGGFGHSFLSAGLTAAVMPGVGRISSDMARTITSAVVGGTISRVTGGKFANGAITSAIMAAVGGRNRRANANVLAGEFDQKEGAELSNFAGTPKEREALIRHMVRANSFGDPRDWSYSATPNEVNPEAWMTTAASGKVTVYPSAFQLDHYHFGSALYHEYVHVLRFEVYHQANFLVRPRSQALYMMEAEAYVGMLSSNNPFLGGASARFRQGMLSSNLSEGIGALTAPNIQRVRVGSFDCAAVEC